MRLEDRYHYFAVLSRTSESSITVCQFTKQAYYDRVEIYMHILYVVSHTHKYMRIIL